MWPVFISFQPSFLSLGLKWHRIRGTTRHHLNVLLVSADTIFSLNVSESDGESNDESSA